MRKIGLLVSLLFFLLTMRTDAAGVGEFQFDCFTNPGPENAEMVILLKNNGDVPLQFEFPTSKLFEISIVNTEGKEVYLYSRGRHFLQAFQTVKIEPHQTYKRVVSWDYMFNGKRVPKGEYTVNSVLLPVTINKVAVRNQDRLTCTTKITVPAQNDIFRDVNVTGSAGKYWVRGKTKAKVFFFTVEDGHNQLITEQKQSIANTDTDWKPFAIQLNIPRAQLPANGSLILNLYERSREGQILNNYPLLLQRF
jgi:hypothetical protein